GDGIYPGAIYTYNDFMMGNMLKVVGAGKRNPITIYTNNVTNSSGDVKVTVNNPSASAINDATSSITRNFSTTVTSATQIGQYTYSENNASMALNITAGGAYAGFSAGAGFTLNKIDHHIYITYDYKIPLYSLSTEIPTTGFFTDPAIEQTPNLVLISNVLYGSRILANIDIDESSFSNDISAKFKYGDPDKTGIKVDADFLLKNTNVKYTVNTYVVGTAASGLSAPKTIEELNNFVNTVIRNTTYQTAKPIGYTLATMAGEVIGIESATDSYIVKNCVPKGAVYYLTGAKVTLGTGNDNKDAGAGLSLLVYPISGGSYWGNFYKMDNYTSELKKYSWVSLNLGKASGFKNFTLDQYKQNGLEVDVVYNSQGGPFPLTDAWALDHVQIELEFRDQNGNIATQAVPPIKWENLNARMSKKMKIYCKTDNYFRPLAPVIGTY
ncbi:MAG: thiol-activated cytolysin family protein, partial [Bacteroidota bacterium]